MIVLTVLFTFIFLVYWALSYHSFSSKTISPNAWRYVYWWLLGRYYIKTASVQHDVHERKITCEWIMEPRCIFRFLLFHGRRYVLLGVEYKYEVDQAHHYYDVQVRILYSCALDNNLYRVDKEIKNEPFEDVDERSNYMAIFEEAVKILDERGHRR